MARSAARFGIVEVFNPSIVVRGSSTHIAFRGALRQGERPYRAFYGVDNGDGIVDIQDLTEFANRLGVRRVADPKLVELQDEVYVSWNTGWVASGENEIYLQRLTPSLSDPQRCVFDGRNRIEKNWAFFERGGDLQVLYSVAPLHILSLAGKFGKDEDLVFRSTTRESVAKVGQRFSIGTQLLRVDSNTFQLIIHDKLLRIRNHRAYVGRLAQLDLSGKPKITFGTRALVHSWRSMLPQVRPNKGNPHLIFATYFSGISSVEGQLLLSYGVNDVDYGFAHADPASLW